MYGCLVLPKMMSWRAVSCTSRSTAHRIKSLHSKLGCVTSLKPVLAVPITSASKPAAVPSDNVNTQSRREPNLRLEPVSLPELSSLHLHQLWEAEMGSERASSDLGWTWQCGQDACSPHALLSSHGEVLKRKRNKLSTRAHRPWGSLGRLHPSSSLQGWEVLPGSSQIPGTAQD